jgi:hypothetical protein
VAENSSIKNQTSKKLQVSKIKLSLQAFWNLNFGLCDLNFVSKGGA